MHLARGKGKGGMVDVTKSCPEVNYQALGYIQAVRSGVLTAKEEVLASLAEGLALIPSDIDGKDLSYDYASVVMEVGRLAIMHGGFELAEEACKRVNNTKIMEINQNQDLIAALAIVQKLGPDVDFYTDAMVRKMSKALEILEKCLQMAIRADDGEQIQDTCVLAWNTGLPLLQPNLRKLVKTIMYIAAEALENIASPLTELRALLHLEMARCELADELIQKADHHTVAALKLDYYVNEEESGKYDLLRPLDRYVITM